ncbi:hypothetical protein BRARA_J00537 [Brassica rapa]|uniref:Uncharacterized protein n=1 Tax=Brassica campestris TaxID=3711 RepID=A0A397XJW1_BRACM|nr:hypothetical protein BRARA_J00537 [Brassica rapa]
MSHSLLRVQPFPVNSSNSHQSFALRHIIFTFFVLYLKKELCFLSLNFFFAHMTTSMEATLLTMMKQFSMLKLCFQKTVTTTMTLSMIMLQQHDLIISFVRPKCRLSSSIHEPRFCTPVPFYE